MGIALPQVVTSDRASGAQVIDGSLKFDSSKSQYLSRTPGSAGNRKTFTISFWSKGFYTNLTRLFQTGTSLGTGNYFGLSYENGKLFLEDAGGFNLYTTALYRDTSAWYHIVYAIDTTQATSSDRVKVYVNGVRVTDFSTEEYPGQNTDTSHNNNVLHYIGAEAYSGPRRYLNNPITNWYNIDGQALDASYFGRTDGLTNTWRPKKYEGTFGTNGFYLPMDGNSPIGEDKSGQGNNWTPVNFGGSVALDNPIVSGAKPILNTDGGGNVARPGVFGSEENQFVTVTVASKTGGGNAYFFGGVERDSLASLRGTTVTFDTTDSTNNTHPFKLSSTNADSSGGTEYTDGVAYYINGSVTDGSTYVSSYSSGAASGFRGIKWTVPHNVSTTYYYCTVHNGMGENGRLTSTTDETKADPYAWKNVLALPLVGANSDISNSVNSGSTTKVMTSVGNAAASSDTSNFYNGSFEFDGSGDGITCPSNTDFNFGSGDFTVECWVKQDDTSGFDVFVGKYNGSSSGEFIVGKNGNTPTFYWQDAGGNANINATNFTGNTSSWYHMACVREGNVFTMYINGICENSTTDATTIKTTSEKLSIGIEHDGSSSAFDGYLQDVRIYKGVSKYSGTTIGTQYFVPPATSPDILPDTPSGVSGGSKLAKVTDGAVSFDGTGDYLDVGTSSDYALGTGDFTIEMYVFRPHDGRSSHNTLFATRGAGGTSTGFNIGIFEDASGRRLYMYSDGQRLTYANEVPVGWVHIAITRSGTALKSFINGVLEGTGTTSQDYTNTSASIGSVLGGAAELTLGFISNFRLIKGTALYTSNFTPPSAAPLTNVTNTKLLCCQSNTSANLAGVSPATFSNSGTVYSSNYAASDSFQATSPATNGFDGNITTRSACSSSGCTVTMTFSPALTVGTSLKIWSGYGVASVNGGTAVNFRQTSPRRQWQDLSFTGTLNTIVITGNDSGYGGDASAGECYAVEVDGCILVDGLTGEAIASAGDAAATNFNPFNTDINTVRGQETGYPTMNPIGKTKTEYFVQDGNLTCGNSSAPSGSSGSRGYVPSTMGFKTGKWYAECVTFRASDGDVDFAIGIFSQNASGYYQNDGTTYNCRPDAKLSSPGGLVQSYGVAWADGDCIGIKVDLDSATKTIQWLKNGIATGDPVTISTDHEFFFGYGSDGGGGGRTYTAKWNFGQKPFKYAPPDGFQPLNAANVRPETVISRPDQYVGVVTYKGSGSVNQIISVSGTSLVDGSSNPPTFNPDLIWIVDRDTSGGARWLFDTVRGSNNFLQSNSTDDQGTRTFTINNNGVSIPAGDGSYNDSSNYVAWCWKAGGNKNTFNVDDVGYASAAAAGLTGGSITPTGASVGTKQGFSIIKYTGTDATSNTFSHGLSQKPDFAIFKNLSQDGDDWIVYHTSLGATKRVKLNTTAIADSQTSQFNDTEPTSSVFTIGTYDNINKLNNNYISYLWTDTPGLQKFGQYEGNTTEGAFVELGFRPAIIWIKAIDQTWYWNVQDAERSPFNPSKGNFLRFDTTAEENAASGNNNIDFLSNGFKIRSTTAQSEPTNVNAQTYIYCAWAEAPTFNLYGAQSNAR